jgi:hypothetical protein
MSDEIQRLQNRLYYITHKDEVNKKRKNYKRQPWSERADNPKNKS